MLDDKNYFFFDFLSPYSFLAWELMKNSTDPNFIEYRKSLHLKPVSMSSIIHSYETKGPAEIPPKRDFLMKSWLRSLKKNKIEAKLPPALPFNSLYALRLSLESPYHDIDLKRRDLREVRFKVVDMIFSKCWKESGDISNQESLEEILDKLEIDRQVFDSTTSKESRKELKGNNKLALSLGVFGVPTWTHSKELFWGSDGFEDLVRYINGLDDYDRALYSDYVKLFEV